MITRRSVLTVLAALIVALAVVRADNAALGTWDFTTVSPEGTFNTVLEIRQQGDKLVAVGKSPRGERPYDSIEVAGSKITLSITIDYSGSPMIITYRGQIDGAKMGGDADFGGLATGSWSATKKTS